MHKDSGKKRVAKSRKAIVSSFPIKEMDSQLKEAFRKLPKDERKLLDEFVTKSPAPVRQPIVRPTMSGVSEENTNIPYQEQEHTEPSILYDELNNTSQSHIVSASKLANMRFKFTKLDGKFAKLLGKIYNPFYLMIYGSRYNGKSSVAMLLANELVKNGYKSLYISNEEGCKGSLQEKLLRLKITQDVHFVEDYDASLFGDYDIVFMDSVQTIGLKPADFKALKAQYPKTSFVIVCKANRDGSSKGGTDWEHDVDAIMHIADRAGTMEKNRFPNGSDETIKFF